MSKIYLSSFSKPNYSTNIPAKQLGLRSAPKRMTPTTVPFVQGLAFAKSQLQSLAARHSHSALHSVFLDHGADCCFAESGSSIGFSQYVGKVLSEPPTFFLVEFPKNGFLGKFGTHSLDCFGQQGTPDCTRGYQRN